MTIKAEKTKWTVRYTWNDIEYTLAVNPCPSAETACQRPRALSQYPSRKSRRRTVRVQRSERHAGTPDAKERTDIDVDNQTDTTWDICGLRRSVRGLLINDGSHDATMRP